MGQFTAFTAAAVVATALPLAAAVAQDAGSYQLPPAPSQTATPQGPVVPDAPPPRAVTTGAPRIETTEPAPVIAIPQPTPAPTASPRARTQSNSRPAPTPRGISTPAVQTTPTLTPDALPTAASAVPVRSIPSPSDEDLEAPQDEWPWGWIGSLMIATLAAAGWLLWRRRMPDEPIAEFAPPVVQRPTSEKPANVEATAAPPPLVVDLVATRMSASLVNATLAYRLILTGSADLTGVVVRADMTSAHASRPAQEQLGSPDAPVVHRLDHIAGGEAIACVGEIRLPLAAITPIRHGTAALFVPLVRIEVTAELAGRTVTLRSAFVVGLDDASSGARLQPFRLDLGPRVYGEVGQRALPVPAFA